ncbi:MAG: tetratricopeptide repeat protein [Reyranella sp.]|nr:tetratricopeptide repeat protein [Reyranella sp.]
MLASAQQLLAAVTPGEPKATHDLQKQAKALVLARRLAVAAADGLAGSQTEEPMVPAALVDAELPDAAPKPKSTEQLLQAARSAYNDGRLDEAEPLYRQILDRFGGHTGALSSLSRLYLRQRRWADAIDVLVRLNILLPQSSEPKRLLARALMEDGQLAAAARAFADLGVLEPDNQDVWQSLGQVQKRLGNWTAARGAWTRLVEMAPDRLEARFELASACHQAGDGAAARAELQAILARNPDHRAALALLGRILLNGNPEGALACWSRLADLDPASVAPRLQMARIHARRHRPEKAEAEFRAVLERDPVHGEALPALARMLATSQPEEAVRLYKRWSDHDPGLAAPWLAIGRLRARAKSHAEAEEAFREAIARAASNVEALTGLARVCSVDRRHDEAMALWLKLAELTPDAIEPRLQIARILHARNDPGTEEALQAILRIDPQSREALRRLAQLLARRRDTRERSLEIWQELADLDAEAVFPLAQRGRLLERMGRLPEAESDYRRAIERNPHSTAALGDLARFYGARQQWEKAAQVYRDHLVVAPDRIDAVVGLGRSLDRLDRLDEAEKHYDRALQLDPDNVAALGYRGRLSRTRGRVDAAIVDFRRICELEPLNAEAWHELIFYLAGAEREAEALDAVAQAEAALGATPEAWVVLARACAAALFDDRAIDYYQRAIAAQPDNAAFHAQLGLYYFRQGILDGALHHLLDSRDITPGNVRDLTAADIEVARRLFETTRALRELGYDHMALRHGPRTVGEIVIPERLFAHVRQLADSIVPYEPKPRSIVAISATLAPGGAERQLANMLRGLSNPSFELDLSLFCISLASRVRRDFFLPVLEGTGVDIVVPDPAATEDYLQDPEVAPFAGVIRHFPPDMVAPMAFWLREFRRRRPQAVHAWQDSTNLTAVVAALLAGVPRIILCCRSVRPDNPRRRLRRFMKVAYQTVLDHPSVIMSNNSRAGADDYAEWLDLEPARVEVVYNGIDFDRLDSSANSDETAQARAELGIPPNVPVLGGVFRMSEEKRPLLWLDVAAAVARANDAVQFVVCGDGPMRDEMRSHAANLGIADRLHLPGARSNIGAWFKMMDVVMLTSRHEGLPNVLLEAQSLGIPVVAPDVGGMSEVVEQGVTGWTIRNADAESLAERVVFCLSDTEWRQVATARAPRFVRERFGIETMLRRNLEVYGIPVIAVSA